MQGPRDNDPGAISEINVIPFIDVCLVLLIIVLMTSAATANFKELNLPAAGSQDYRDMNLAITLSLARASDAAGKPLRDSAGKAKYQFFFEEDTTPIDPKNLWTHLKTVQQDNKWSLLVLRIDKETPYEFMQLAVQCAQALGVEDVSFALKTEGEDRR